MIYLQTVSSHLSILQVYAIAAVAFMVIPATLAGGATLFMRKRMDSVREVADIVSRGKLPLSRSAHPTCRPKAQDLALRLA